MKSYADFVKDLFCLTQQWCIFMNVWVFRLFLRNFMRLVEKLVDLSTSKFVSVAPGKPKYSSGSMDVIDIPSSDSETEQPDRIPASRILPASISGFVGKSENEPLLTTFSFSSHPNGWDSHQKINEQDEPEFNAVARTVDKSYAISPCDVDNTYSAASGESLRDSDPHSSMRQQQHESQLGNGFYTEKTNGNVSSDKTTEYRRLPKTLKNIAPVIEISDTDFNKNSRQMNGRDRSNGGSITGSHLNGEHQRAHTGFNSERGFRGVDDDRGKTTNHRPHFQLYGDPPVPKYEIKKNLSKSFQTGKPISEYETSAFADGGASSGGSNTGRQTFYMVDEGLRMENEDEEEISIYKVPRQRVLPASFTGSGKSVGHPHPAGFSGVTRFTGVETPMENDETPIYQAALQDLSQPRMEVDVPEGVLSVQLLRHQKIALAWMAQKETIGPNCLGGILADDQGLGKTVSTIALIKIQGPRQPETVSRDAHQMKFEPLNLDEDDDNVSVSDKVNEVVISEKAEKESTFISMAAAPRKGRPAAGTLIVCPASVLRQWARELDEKVTEGEKLKVLIYHGSTRTRDPTELATFDVVLTTYSIVSNEVPKLPQADEDEEEQKNMDTYALSSRFSTNKKRKKASNAGKKKKKSKKGMDDSAVDSESGPLARVLWFRLVLDEAQSIKNHRTQVARACCGLRAKRRWCLSGTPIQNTIDDLYSYFRFLRYDPYATYKSFCATIKYPISKNSIHGYMKLQAVLKTVMLRRTKETQIDGRPVLQLPPKSVSLKKVNFSPQERAFYSSLEADFRSQFKKYADEGTVNQNYANILLMLLRLRQACDHPLLAEGFHSKSVGTPSLKMARNLPKEMLIYLLNLLEPSAAICRLCNDPPEDAVVTMCGHVFCYQCLSDMLAGDCNSCPVEDCKDQVSPDSTFSRATLRSSISGKFDNDNDGSSSGVDETFVDGGNTLISSKIRAALEILSAVCKPKKASSALISNGSGQTVLSTEITSYLGSSACSSKLQLPDKVIVFSQWTSMLDLLENSIKESSIQFRRLDGTMTLASRDKAVKDFTNNPEVTVMIMSLKAGNLGLNMVAANHVIILDLWWNPTTEDQAVDRAHRIGQTRQVTVSRLTIENSVEDRILALQEKKREMVSSAFGEDKTGGSATRLTVEDLRYLFMGGSL